MPEGDTITPVVSSPALRFSRNFMFPTVQRLVGGPVLGCGWDVGQFAI